MLWNHPAVALVADELLDVLDRLGLVGALDLRGHRQSGSYTRPLFELTLGLLAGCVEWFQ